MNEILPFRQDGLEWLANQPKSIVYKDAASPGNTTVGRDAFNQMMAHFRSPNVQEVGILIWKYSRFARDIDDAQFYRADLRRRGFEFHSINDSIPTGPDGRFFEAAIDWMNQRFLIDLSTDVKRGLNHIVEQYGAVPGTPPRGSNGSPSTLVNAGMARTISYIAGSRIRIWFQKCNWPSICELPAPRINKSKRPLDCIKAKIAGQRISETNSTSGSWNLETWLSKVIVIPSFP